MSALIVFRIHDFRCRQFILFSEQASKTWLHEEPNGTGQRLQQGHIGNCKWKEEDWIVRAVDILQCILKLQLFELSKELKRNELAIN